MKPRVVIAFVLLAGAAALYAQAPATSSAKQEGKALAATTTASVRRMLSMSMPVPGSQVSMRDLFEYVSGQAAKQGQGLDMLIDQDGIKLVESDAPFYMDEMISFPAGVRQMTLQQMLEHVAAWSSARVELTYLIRQGRIEFVPIDFARIEHLMDRGVTIQFKETPVALAIEELSDLTGLTIAVDPRCGEALTRPVTLRTSQDMSVRGVLECLADMHDLRLIVDEHRAFLTTQKQYIKRLTDRIEEAKMLKALDPIPPTAGGGVGMLGGYGAGGGMGGGAPIPMERPRQHGRKSRDAAAQ